MRIIVTKDYNDMSRKAANIISAQIILNPESVLGLATLLNRTAFWGLLQGLHRSVLIRHW